MTTPAVGGPHPRVHPVLRIVLVATIALLWWVFSVAPQAAAHAELLKSTPADGSVQDDAPKTVQLTFNEPVRVVDGGVHLFTPDGADTEPRAVVRDHTVVVDLPPEPTEGAHTLTYRVVSADGHPIGGAITYGVDTLAGATDAPLESTDAPRSTEWLVAGSAAMQYLGLLVLVGLLVFDLLRGGVSGLDRLDQRSRPVPGQRSPTVVEPVETAPGRKTSSPFRKLLWASWSVTVGGSLLLVPAFGLRAVGAPVWALFHPPTWWSAVSTPSVLAALIVGVAGTMAVLLGPGGRIRRNRPTRRAGWIALGVAAIALTAPVWVGHTQTIAPRWLGVLADLTHLGAASIWTGGLLGLVVLLRQAKPDTESAGSAGESGEAGESVELARAVIRFSGVALASVLALTASGTVLAVLVLPDWASLLDTGYGRTLLIKLGVVAAVLALASWNRFRLVPSIRAETGALGRWCRLRAILRREFALVVAVVTITGVLANSSPAHDHHETEAPRIQQLSAESQELVVEGTLTPAIRGANVVEFELAHHGESFDGTDVMVRARLPERGIGPIEAVPEQDAGMRRYRADITLPASGEWRLEIIARTSTYEQPVIVVPVSIG